MDATAIGFFVLVAPPLLAALLYVSPVSGMIVGGLILTYSGAGMAMILGQMPTFGINLFATGVGIAVAGVSLIAYGAILNAVLRAIDRIPRRLAHEMDGRAEAQEGGAFFSRRN